MKNLPYIPVMLLVMAFSATSTLCLSQISQNIKLGDENPITVVSLQDMQFGTFSQGPAGGTIAITPQGDRSTTGSITPLNMGAVVLPLIFEVEAPIGSIISISRTENIIMNGSNGGTMTLKIGDAVPGNTFISNTAPPGRTQVMMGGTLTVGNLSASPPGSYSGKFNITFMLE